MRPCSVRCRPPRITGLVPPCVASAPNATLNMQPVYNEYFTGILKFSLPIPFPIVIRTQSHAARLPGPTGDGWRIGFIPWMVFPQLSFLFWDWFRIVLVCSLYGAVAGEIVPHHHRAGGVRRPGVDGRYGGRRGVVGADPGSCRHVGGRWSPSRRPGLATLKVGELTQTLVSGGGNVGSGRRPTRCSRRWRAWQ